MKYKLSKKIAYKIIKEEIKNTNIPVNIELVNKYENIYNIIKK